MGRAKEIIVKVIPAKIANEFVKKHHYSGKVVINSILHFGCFLDDKLHGVMSYGPGINKHGNLKSLSGVGWNEIIELNRMAFDEYLPKYSESRCISISIKLIKKNAPQIKAIISFSDGTQSGDGTIYRASGFFLTGITKNTSILELPNGEKINKQTFGQSGSFGGDGANAGLPKRRREMLNAGFIRVDEFLNNKYKGWKTLEGFQLRYIYLIDKTCKITVPILPFSMIDEMGAGMYKGKKVSLQERKQNAAIAHLGERLASSQEGAFDATMPLNSLI